jgi:integrase/recombinase XerD
MVVETLSFSVVRARSEIREAFEVWLEALQVRGVSLRTLENYRECVGKFVAFIEQYAHTLDAVEPTHIRKWLLFRRQQGVSPHTLSNDHRNPRAFWNFCLREELTTNDPFAKVAKPKVPFKQKPALEPEQVARLLRACEGSHWLMHRDYALVLTLLDTGLRIAECHALRVGDAQEQSLFVQGKGGKMRVVFLSPETRLRLKKYLKACPFTLHDSSPLWQGEKGALTLHGLKNALRAIRRRAGIVPLGAHALRRTFAVWSLRSGIDLERLRLLMGHSDYSVLRHYLNLVETDLKQAHQRHSPLNLLVGKRR